MANVHDHIVAQAQAVGVAPPSAEHVQQLATHPQHDRFEEILTRFSRARAPGAGGGPDDVDTDGDDLQRTLMVDYLGYMTRAEEEGKKFGRTLSSLALDLRQAIGDVLRKHAPQT